MTPDERLDHILGQLDGPATRLFEERLQEDPALAAAQDRLGRGLALLLDDGEGPEPPGDLVRRTILRVEVERRRRSIREFIPNRVSPRWADVAVAASILVAGLLTLLPAVQRSQLAARSVACAANLRELGIGLIRYANQHNSFPHAATASTMPFAGSFAIQLREAGLIDDARLLDCPSNGRNPLPPVLPCFHDLSATLPTDAPAIPCLRHSDYAYTLGYENGGVWPPLARDLPDNYPLLSDRPPHDPRGHALDGNSPNHHGAGQYVLFVGGHTRFAPTRRLGQDLDFFRNDRARTAPGVRINDYVLAPGITPISGR